MKPRNLLSLSALGALLAACPTPSPSGDASTPTDSAAESSMDAAATADSPAMEAAAPRDAAVDVLRPPDLTSMQTEAMARANRGACMYRSGAWPAETLGSDTLQGDQIPVDHVLVLMQENRSFDHYYGRLPNAAGAMQQTDVEAPPAGWSNPDTDGTPVPLYHDTTFCIADVEHGWDGSHGQWNNGMNNGFVRFNQPNGRRAMGYVDDTDIPFYYSLASTFSIADHYYASVMGPTWPNRFYLMAATSFGLTDNVPVASDNQDTPANNIFWEMERAGREWRDYADGPRMLAFFPYFALDPVRGARTRRQLRNVATDLFADLASGNLPALSIIEPNYTGPGGDRVDEHPPGTPQSGSAWVERIVRAVMASPKWNRIALFITYDEHGGFADHVPPPPACTPDDLTPTDGTRPSAGAFDRYGFRVPMMVVSPYARRHFVAHRTYDHTSIVRFIQSRFGLPAMTRRDANAEPPMEMFDFQNPPFMTPPTLAMSRVDPAVVSRCNMAFPSGSAF